MGHKHSRLTSLDLPDCVLEQVLLYVGAMGMLHFEPTCRQHCAQCCEDRVWRDLSKQIWPCTTLPPAVTEYLTFRELVLDKNRRCSLRAWKPKQGGWCWRHNTRDRFYCGGITVCAVDEVARELCLFVHAVSNRPDMRPASCSAIYKQAIDASLDCNASLLAPWQAIEKPRCELRACRGGENGGLLEDRVVLRWPFSAFKPGFKYCFQYTSQLHTSASGGFNPSFSDYPMIFLFGLPPAARLTGAEVETEFPHSVLAFADAAPSAHFIPREHYYETEELSGPLYDVAVTLLGEQLPQGCHFPDLEDHS